MDFDKYTDEMKKSLWDKAFFMDKIIGAKCIVDFGCADGSLICLLADMFPEMTFYGYDHLPIMIERARQKARPNTSFYNSWDLTEMCKKIQSLFKPQEICLNFSSVLHEVFSSTDGTANIKYIKTVLKPKYITVRDMYYDGDNRSLRLAFINHAVQTMNIDAKSIEDFESYNEPIVTHRGFLHFLMKYQWKDNGWDKELQENYFAWTEDQLCQLLGPYEKIFETYYLLPYYAEQWKKIDINPCFDHTHAQFIFRRED